MEIGVYSEFEWFNPKQGIPMISIANYGITLSKSTLDILGNPTFVKLGYNCDNSLLCIQCCDSNDACAIELRYSSKQLASGYVRICAKDFVEKISAIGNHGFSKITKRYIATYDSVENAIVADLISGLIIRNTKPVRPDQLAKKPSKQEYNFCN